MNILRSTILSILSIGVLASTSFGQDFRQYFDGDTIGWWIPIEYEIDTSGGNVWQVGKPQKHLFDSAASIPNVLITDTISFYPSADTSSVEFIILDSNYWYGIQAIQWSQKLDMDYGLDGGYVEFRTSRDSAWKSVFNNPYVYNFYGFDPSNIGTLLNGDSVFTGTDSTWKDIWLCFDYSYTSYSDTLFMKLTFVSDSNDTQKEGWMIDNILMHRTYIHTVKENESSEYLRIYPTPSTGRINIEAQKINDYHIIESIEVMAADGKIVKKYGRAPTKFFIDLSDYPDGAYFLKIRTNLKTEIHQIVLQK